MKKRVIGTMALLAMAFLFLGGCTPSVTESVSTGQEEESAWTEDSFPSDMSAAAERDPAENSDSSASAPAKIYVYVCGAVNAPGVYELPGNSRVCNAIEKAGGLTADADLTTTNQAKLLADGEQITVLTKEEAEAVPAGSSISAGGAGTRVNINTADETALQTLSGIGATKAAAIVDYRDTNGAFRTIEEITKVAGIGQGTFEKIKDQITVG